MRCTSISSRQAIGGREVPRASSQLFSAQEVNEMLERGIAQLSDKQSCVYRLNVYENMPVREIATTLNLSYKNTENRLGFARKRVRDFMKKALAS